MPDTRGDFGFRISDFGFAAPQLASSAGKPQSAWRRLVHWRCLASRARSLEVPGSHIVDVLIVNVACLAPHGEHFKNGSRIGVPGILSRQRVPEAQAWTRTRARARYHGRAGGSPCER